MLIACSQDIFYGSTIIESLDRQSSWSAKLIHDEFPKPQVRRIVVPLAMPHHSQDERRQAKRLRAGAEIQPFSKPVDHRFLNTAHQVARCYCMQQGQTVRQSQPQPSSQSSRSELVVNQAPYLVAVDDGRVIQPCKALNGEPMLPQGMAAPRNYDVVLLRKRFHYQTGREMPGVGKISDCEVEGSIPKLGFRHCKKPVKTTSLHLQIAGQHGSGEQGDQAQFHVIAERDAKSLGAHRGIKRIRHFKCLAELDESRSNRT